MKMDYDAFRRNAMGASEAVETVAEEATEKATEEASDAITSQTVNAPRMGVKMGPEGTEIDVSAPLEDMSAEEAIKFAQEVQGPDLSEQIVELLKDPSVRRALKTVWYGPDEQESAQKIGPAEEVRPMENVPEIEADGGELDEENIYEITPEGFVAILEEEIQKFATIKPNMKISEVGPFIDANRDDVVKGVKSKFEELDG